MLRTCILLALILTIALPSYAQNEEKQRLSAARQEIRALRDQAEKLPKAGKLKRRELPTPYPMANELAQKLHQFARLYSDLSEANTARELMTRCHLSNIDPAGALAVYTQLLATESINDNRKRDYLLQAIALRRQYGDFGGAAAELEARIKKAEESQTPNAADLNTFRALLGEVQKEQAQADALFLPLMQQAADASPARKNKALLRGRRLASLRPMSAYAEKIWLSLLAESQQAKSPAFLVYAERMAYFFPNSKAWLNASLAVFSSFAQDGEYEKAQLHGIRLMQRSELMAATQTKSVAAGLRLISQKLATIEKRDLGLERNTKKARLADFNKKSASGDAVLLEELALGFQADYPGAKELPYIQFTLAEALRNPDPEAAVKIYKKLAAGRSEYAFRALMRAQELIAKQESAEASEEFLAALAGQFKDPNQAVDIALCRAKILDDNEKWEAAKAILEAQQDQEADAQRLEALSQAIASLDKKLN